MATTLTPHLRDWLRWLPFFPLKLSQPSRMFGDGFWGTLSPPSPQRADILMKGTFPFYRHLWVLILQVASDGTLNLITRLKIFYHDYSHSGLNLLPTFLTLVIMLLFYSFVEIHDTNLYSYIYLHICMYVWFTPISNIFSESVVFFFLLMLSRVYKRFKLKCSLINRFLFDICFSYVSFKKFWWRWRWWRSLPIYWVAVTILHYYYIYTVI